MRLLHPPEQVLRVVSALAVFEAFNGVWGPRGDAELSVPRRAVDEFAEASERSYKTGDIDCSKMRDKEAL